MKKRTYYTLIPILESDHLTYCMLDINEEQHKIYVIDKNLNISTISHEEFYKLRNK